MLSTITKAEILRRRATLEAKLNELEHDSTERDELHIEWLADPLDQVRSSADRELAIQRLDNQTRLIHEIELALSNIEESTYGFCEGCGEPIPRKRLAGCGKILFG